MKRFIKTYQAEIVMLLALLVASLVFHVFGKAIFFYILGAIVVLWLTTLNMTPRR